MKKYIFVILLLIFYFGTKAQEKFYYNESNYLNYQIKGSGSINLIFLHGFGASNNSWEEIQPMFDSTVYTSYLIDLKGFGKSSIPKDNKYTMLDHEKVIADFIDSNIIGDYFLFGHSYGGGVSLLTAISEQPKSKPKSLILIDCAAYHTKTPFFIRPLQIPVINRMIYLFSTPKFRARFTLKRVVKRENFTRQIQDRYTKSIKGKGKAYSYIKTAKQIVPDNYEQFTDAFKRIQIPTLIIWGRQDYILPLKDGEKLAKQIKNSTIEILEECGHIPHEEYPVKTFKIIKKFFNEMQK